MPNNDFKESDYDFKTRKMIMNEDEFIKLHRALITGAFILQIISGYVIFIGLHNPTTESNAIWFQRSGSILVLLAVISELVLLKLESLVKETPVRWQKKSKITPKEWKEEVVCTDFERFVAKKIDPAYTDGTFKIILEPLTYFYAVLGTIIWGYGDLIYNYF